MCVCVCTYYIILNQLSIDGHLGCFHVLAIANGAAMNVGMCVFFQIRVFIFSRYMPRGGIAGSYGRYLIVVLICISLIISK